MALTEQIKFISILVAGDDSTVSWDATVRSLSIATHPDKLIQLADDLREPAKQIYDATQTLEKLFKGRADINGVEIRNNFKRLIDNVVQYEELRTAHKKAAQPLPPIQPSEVLETLKRIESSIEEIKNKLSAYEALEARVRALEELANSEGSPPILPTE